MTEQEEPSRGRTALASCQARRSQLACPSPGRAKHARLSRQRVLARACRCRWDRGHAGGTGGAARRVAHLDAVLALDLVQPRAS
eukprot:6196246-Pleurochrysis_carterae.AAC.3